MLDESKGRDHYYTLDTSFRLSYGVNRLQSVYDSAVSL